MKDYNLDYLVGQVQTRLKDVEYDRDTIIDFLNQTYFQIVGQSTYPFMEQCQHQDVVRGGTFELAPNFQSAILLICDNETGTHKMSYMPASDFLEKKNSITTMYKYTIFGKHLEFNVPEYERDTDQKYNHMSLYYLSRPCALKNGEDEPCFPYEYSEALVLGALARAERLRDNFDFAQIYENQMNDIVVDMGSRYNPRSEGFVNRAKLPVRQYLGV